MYIYIYIYVHTYIPIGSHNAHILRRRSRDAGATLCIYSYSRRCMETCECKPCGAKDRGQCHACSLM